MATRIFSSDLTIVLSKLDALASIIPVETNLSARKFAEQLLWDSDNVPPMVPVDTHALQSTGHVEKVEGSRPAQWAVVYGGVAFNGVYVDYAEKIHDWLGERNWQRPGSGPKFVQAHVDRRRPEMELEMNVTLTNIMHGVGF